MIDTDIKYIIAGDSVIVWKQPDRILSAGLSMIRKDARMSLQEHSQGDLLTFSLFTLFYLFPLFDAYSDLSALTKTYSV